MSSINRIDNERGHIGEQIQHGIDRNGEKWANFSLGSDVNRRNEQGQWEKTGTNWRQVHAHGVLAENFVASFEPGDAIVVSGRVTPEARMRTINGEQQIGVRDNVRADMIAPDMLYTEVHFRHRKGEEVRPAVPQEGMAPQPEAQPAARSGAQTADRPSPATQGFSGSGPTADEASLQASTAQNWPPVTQPGQAAYPTPY